MLAKLVKSFSRFYFSIENLNNRDFRAIMFDNCKRGLNVAKCTAEMFLLLGIWNQPKQQFTSGTADFVWVICAWTMKFEPDARLRRSLMKTSSRWRN